MVAQKPFPLAILTIFPRQILSSLLTPITNRRKKNWRQLFVNKNLFNTLHNLAQAAQKAKEANAKLIAESIIDDNTQAMIAVAKTGAYAYNISVPQQSNAAETEAVIKALTSLLAEQGFEVSQYKDDNLIMVRWREENLVHTKNMFQVKN